MAQNQFSRFHDKEEISELITKLRRSFDDGLTRQEDFRRRQLHLLYQMINDNEARFFEAFKKDLGRCEMESYIIEFTQAINEIVDAIRQLKRWMSPTKRKLGLVNLLDNGYTLPEPYGRQYYRIFVGLVLIIGAWNFPMSLLIQPLVGALAAGNTVILKPSEMSLHVGALLTELLPKYLDSRCYAIVQGGPTESEYMLTHPFDYIFFTGSTAVGKLVAMAAAKHLTPTTLELGGKSPCIVDDSCDLATAAHRIVWGKFSNTGQICIAPDYILCTKATERKLILHLKAAIKDFYGEDPRRSPHYPRIITVSHAQRLASLLSKTLESGLAVSEMPDSVIVPSEKYVPPIILSSVHPTSHIMKEEIFGPILPIVSLNDSEEFIPFIKKEEKPLALYIFSKHASLVEDVIRNTSSGSVCVNDTLMHYGANLPFGGVGKSGMGAYHGCNTFKTFSHDKPVLWRPPGFEYLVSWRYPPFKSWTRRAMDFLARKRL